MSNLIALFQQGLTMDWASKASHRGDILTYLVGTRNLGGRTVSAFLCAKPTLNPVATDRNLVGDFPDGSVSPPDGYTRIRVFRLSDEGLSLDGGLSAPLVGSVYVAPGVSDPRGYVANVLPRLAAAQRSEHAMAVICNDEGGVLRLSMLGADEHHEFTAQGLLDSFSGGDVIYASIEDAVHSVIDVGG